MNYHYTSQSTKFFTKYGILTVDWQGDKKPFYLEYNYFTRKDITVSEKRLDVLHWQLQVIDYSRKFIQDLDWDSLEDMSFQDGKGYLKIVKS